MVSLSNQFVELSIEKKIGESREDEKNGDHQSGLEKSFLKPATHEASSCRAITAESGTKTGFRALEQYPRYEKKAQQNLNIGQNLDHCLPRAKSRGLYETILT